MKILHLLLALLIGLGLGLAYSWYISPVTYVDASPAILRSDFKDQFRDVIAASYVSTHDLARARARLSLLGDADVIAELSAQAQRMVAAGESFERIQPLAQLAADLRQGFVSSPATSTEFAVISTPFAADTPVTETPTAAPDVTETQSTAETVLPTLATATTPTPTVTPTTSFAQTALIPLASSTFAPRPTFTPIPPPGAPFTLASQESICEPGSQAGLMQFILMDKRRNQLAGIEIVITSNQGEDHSFTGFKPELGNGYADFVMQADTTYSVRVVDGGILIPDIIAPTCTDPNNGKYTGGVLLIFQQR